MRHAITKMATIHMVATEESRKRIIQMGEHPKAVFNVGGLGVDNISKMKLLTKSEIEKKLKFKFLKNNFLVTFHPATNNTKNSITHFDNLLSILSKYQDTRIIFTLPNSDVGSRLISKKIHEFVELHKNAIAFSALGDLNYLSIVKLVDMVIGNSSSGLLEVPALRVPTINIGDRQLGRERATSVLDVNGSVFQIDDAIRKIYSKKINILKIYNPYGNGGANSLIIKIISSIVNKPLKKQKFFDIKFEVEK
jgi:UDP-hydrolysing UDP-N-acetyl-D-glucosamine 2-epimerase